MTGNRYKIYIAEKTSHEHDREQGINIYCRKKHHMNMTGNRYKYILQKNHDMNMTGNRYKYILQKKHHMNMTGNRYKIYIVEKSSYEHEREQV